MTHMRLGLLVAGLLLIAALAVGCGESDAEKAQNQVCDARADLNKQVNELAALTPATATTEGVQKNLDAIKTDLNDIKDAQPDLNDDRKQEVESANQEFASQVQTVASDLGTNLSASGAKAKLQSAATQLQTAYKQTFAKVDCG
jgi:dsDNA-specific endonuclease/ATPase MutS2